MCGIGGIVDLCDPVDTSVLVGMRDTMAHRGPDHGGVWISSDRRVGLFHRRLSIIDLSDAANQPMAGNDGSVLITFNGEIYNFQDLRKELVDGGLNFRTQGDTEVILQAYKKWGSSCVQRLRGMFAFALVDLAQQKLILARDRVGEKPLYYS